VKLKILVAVFAFLIISGAYIYFVDSSLIPPSIIAKVKWVFKTESDPIQITERIIGIPAEAYLNDPDYKVGVLVSGLDRPTTMTFVGDQILVLEKDTGKVRHVKNGVLQERPVLDLAVSSLSERGLLGITNVNSTVYIYFTKAEHDGGESLGNHIFKYDWDGNELKDPVLVNIFPSYSITHNGGDMVTDLKGNVYAIMGDQTVSNGTSLEDYRILQNVQKGEVDDTGVIIRVGLDESEPKPSLTPNPFDHYFAIGIRNGFGLAVDPITGNLWDTENGPHNFDEVNLVLPKFNSGWAVTMGPATDAQLEKIPELGYVYSDPEFSWEKTIAPTGLAFINSDQFRKYDDSLFVGDCMLGNLYRFQLNEDRTNFIFNDSNLRDLVVNLEPNEEGIPGLESMDEIIFGSNFGCISDVISGPDGLLYIVSVTSGAIYQISPS